MRSKIITYVDPYTSGHHAAYFRFFSEVCAEIGAELHAYVPATLFEECHDANRNSHQVLAKDIDLSGKRSRYHVNLLSELASVRTVDASNIIFFPMLDLFVPIFAMRALTGRKMATPWTGIFFRDSFNYPTDEVDKPYVRARSTVKGAMLRIAMRQSPLPLLVLNDEWRLALPHGWQFIPDAFTELDRLAGEAVSQRAFWPLPQVPERTNERMRFLLYGALARGKGVLEFCNGLLVLRPEELRRVSLRLVGSVSGTDAYRAQVKAVIKMLQAKGAEVELTDAFVPVCDLDNSIRWCDVLVGTYINHVGQSGILSAAVQYGRPLIAQRKYQMGDLVRKYELGQAVEPTDPQEVAESIRRALDGKLKLGAQAMRYRDGNSYEHAHHVAQSFFARFLEQAP